MTPAEIRISSSWRGVLSCLLGFLLAVEPGWVSGSPSQEKTKPLYSQAEQEFFEGNFDRSLDLLAGYLKDPSLTLSQRKAGMVLVVNNNLAQNDQKSASLSIQRLLLLDPEFEAPEDSPAFKKALAQVRAELADGQLQPEEGGGIRLVFALLVIVGALAAIILLTGGGN
jgi:hypothetical protein